nr:DUF4180 domain-containing protein [uncultured Oscillibacter sp.]
MNIKKITVHGRAVAVIESETPVITDAQSALDGMMRAKYECGASRIAIQKEALAEDFFILSTGLAGEILQKFMNYGVKCAVYGDFNRYTSKPLQDFIRESNRRGTDVLFVEDRREAAARLAEI